MNHITKATLDGVLSIYKRAWETQDPDLILTIFTEDATYHERVLEKPYVGHEQIRQYWKDKVVDSQSNISFNPLNSWIDGNTAIAEWEANFFDKAAGVQKYMREIAILEFRENRICSLREYWSSKIVDGESA